MLNKNEAWEIASKYAEEVRKVLNPNSVIFFGSYVGGTPHEYSDIDIAVVFNDFQGNWLETTSLLFKLTRYVSIDIEPHMMDETNDCSGFLEHVKKSGEVIYDALW